MERLSRTPLYLIGGMVTLLVLFFHGVPTAHSLGFSKTKKITIQEAQVTGSSDLVDFPVMIKLTGDDFREIEDDTRADGYDIVFRASDGTTSLPHEIEVYDESADLLIAWVKIPSLSATSNTDIYIFYGDPSISFPTESPSEVWDTHFRGVWHLNEDPSGAAPQILDSTGNPNDGTAQGGMKSNDLVAGKIGGALDFDGSDDYINGGNDASLDVTTGITLEAWVKPDQIEFVSRYILYKSNAYFLSSMRVSALDDTPNLYLYINGVGWRYMFADTSLTTDWNHLAATYDTAEKKMRIYIDGVEVKASTLSGLSNYTIRTTTNFLYIGGPKHKGLLDEARLSDIARSPDWIKTQFNNQSSPLTFYTVGAQDDARTDLPSISITSPTGTTSYSTTTGTITLGGVASDDVGVVDVIWVNEAGGSDVCSGTTTWNTTSIPLAPGTNVITVTAWDADGNPASDILTVTYTPDSGDDGTGGDYGGTGDTALFQMALEPNVLILFDTSGSMADVSWLDGFNPESDYTTPLLSAGKDVVFVQSSVNSTCYPDDNYVFTTTALGGMTKIEYQNQDGSGQICGSISTSALSDSNGYFYFHRAKGKFIEPNKYDNGKHIKVFLPYANESVNPPNVYYKSGYDNNYLNWIFYHTTQADRDALENQHKIPAERAMLLRVHVAKQVVKDLIDSTPDARFGLMKFDPTYPVYDGGRILADIPSSHADLHAAIDGFWVAGRTPLAEALEDAWDYFRGVDVYGHSFTQDHYCRRNHVIVMTDGAPSSDADDLSSGMKKDWDGDSGGTEANGWSGNEDDVYPGSGSDYLDDIAHYISRNDGWSDLDGTQNVTTHTIGFTIKHDLLEQTAFNGGGQYYTADNAQELSTAFNDIMQEIIEVSDSYAVPMVPISRTEKTTNEAKIYMALFKPSSSAFWKGNIKKFAIATSDNEGLGIAKGDILDRNGDLATGASGQILETASSYWGTGAPDGGDAEKGGVGEILLNRIMPRRIFAYLDPRYPLVHPNNAFSLTNVGLEWNKLNPVKLQTEDPAETVINFIHGYDSYDEDGDSIYNEKRDWILGAFLHSRPSIVAYTSATVIFAGANDGMLHAFDENTGEELWAYIPPVLIPRLKDLSGNDQVYYVDGSPRVYLNDVNHNGIIEEGDQAILICGLRRGGRSYFALDVTDPLNPEIPAGWANWGQWEGDTWQSTGMIGPDMTTESSDEAAASYPYAEMGQSWSIPVIGKINDGGTAKNVFFIGGGYDRNQDSTNPLSTDETMGRGAYVIHVFTGDPIWKYTEEEDSLDMIWSVPSDIAAIDTTDSGFIDRLYVGDMGGKLWRFDIGESNPGSWAAKILFNSNSPDDGGRKIFYPADVTLEEGYELVFFGTGNRTDPRARTVVDRIYAVRDRNPASPLDEDDLVDVTLDCLQEDCGVDTETLRNQILSGNGWYIRLADNSGEKALASPLVFGGVTYFTTFTPVGIDDPCVFDEGIARLYALDYRTGEAVLNYDTTTEALSRSDRSLVIGSGIPSALVMAIMQGQLAAYVGIRGGIANPIIEEGGLLSRIYWRQL